MSDEVMRDRARIGDALDGFVAWREFGWSRCCTNLHADNSRCGAPAVSIIAFVRADGGVDISTFCEDHGRRIRAVLRSMPLQKQPTEWLDRPEQPDAR